MPNDGQTLVEQLRASIQAVLDALSRSHEIITRLDARGPKAAGVPRLDKATKKVPGQARRGAFTPMKGTTIAGLRARRTREGDK